MGRLLYVSDWASRRLLVPSPSSLRVVSVRPTVRSSSVKTTSPLAVLGLPPPHRPAHPVDHTAGTSPSRQQLRVTFTLGAGGHLWETSFPGPSKRSSQQVNKSCGQTGEAVRSQSSRPTPPKQWPHSALSPRAGRGGSACRGLRGSLPPGAPTLVIPRQQTEHRGTESHVLPGTATSRCPV